MIELPTSPSIVVGIDGSKSALHAAVWAVDEAVDRDIPLRLVHVIDPDLPYPAMRLASARAALHDASTAVLATEKPVKIETEIWHGRPNALLTRASSSAKMVCVGSIGRRRLAEKVPSTAAGIASSAHCPVAIVRGHGGAQHPGWIVVHADESPTTSAVVQQGIEEARLRNVPLHVVTTWHGAADDDGGRCVQAQLERRLACWTRSHPDVEIRPVAFRGTLLNYVTKHKDSVRLVIADMGHSSQARELLQPAGYAALRHTDCSMLMVCSRHL